MPNPTDPQAALAAALVAFQAEMPTVHKGKTANVPMKSGGSYSYKYADLADVSAAAMPLLTKHGLSFIATPRAADRGYELVGVLLHTSGGREEGALPLHGNTPQEIGSALTYARRYLMGCMTGIVTDDDTDAQPAQGAARTRQWDGPSTATLLNQIDSDAARAGVTYETATAAFCTKRNIDINGLEQLQPWEVQPLALAVKNRADEVVKEQEAAQAAAVKPGADAETATAPATAAGDPGHPWGPKP